MQLQRPETKGDSRRAQDTASGLPIRPGCRLHNHGGPTITGSGRRFSSLEIAISFLNSRFRSRRSAVGSIAAYRTSSPPNGSPPIARLSSPRFTPYVSERLCWLESSAYWPRCCAPQGVASTTSDTPPGPKRRYSGRSSVQARCCRSDRRFESLASLLRDTTAGANARSAVNSTISPAVHA